MIPINFHDGREPNMTQGLVWPLEVHVDHFDVSALHQTPGIAKHFLQKADTTSSEAWKPKAI